MSEPTPEAPKREPRTPEEIQRLAAEQNGYVVTDSGDDGVSQPFTDFPSMSDGGPLSDGEIIDAEIVDDGSGNDQAALPPAQRARKERTKDQPRAPREAKTGPPSLDEWTGFFSRVVLRVVTEYYISYAFRGIDEELLTEREVERLAMSDDERQLIAVPFAEISNKSKFMRKHGRMIVASGDAFNALVVLGMWASRVNRIAAKYRPRQPKSQVRVNGMSASNGSSGPGEAEATGQEGSAGGYIPPGFPVFPGAG
jgi:hypothetical protein